MPVWTDMTTVVKDFKVLYFSITRYRFKEKSLNSKDLKLSLCMQAGNEIPGAKPLQFELFQPGQTVYIHIC